MPQLREGNKSHQNPWAELPDVVDVKVLSFCLLNTNYVRFALNNPVSYGNPFAFSIQAPYIPTQDVPASSLGCEIHEN
jgi:hypothetical protein